MLGPLRIRGRHEPMTGPMLEGDVELPSRWITRYRARLLDETKAPESGQTLWCHTALHLPPYYLPSLVLGPGLSEIAFPKGFGVRLRGARPARVSAMLQSEDAATDRALYFELAFDAPGKNDPPPKELLHYAWAMRPDALKAESVSGWYDWWVPPGRHAYRQEFTLPCAGKVHFATTHLHRYAARVRILDAATGTALLDKPVAETPARTMVETPVWSDAAGFLLAKDRPYVFEAAYDNPLSERVSAMATLHLFFHPEPACDLPPPEPDRLPPRARKHH